VRSEKRFSNFGAAILQQWSKNEKFKLVEKPSSCQYAGTLDPCKDPGRG
jgi:hypothetical protein